VQDLTSFVGESVFDHDGNTTTYGYDVDQGFLTAR